MSETQAMSPTQEIHNECLLAQERGRLEYLSERFRKVLQSPISRSFVRYYENDGVHHEVVELKDGRFAHLYYPREGVVTADSTVDLLKAFDAARQAVWTEVRDAVLERVYHKVFEARARELAAVNGANHG